MKVWMIIAIVGVLAIAGFAVVNAIGISEAPEVIAQSQPSCGGGCSVDDTCGSSSCGIADVGCRG